ncbi:hypothetical protein NBCG_00599 [Nocardioidaceae bacterium Broad-1]|nr:hypothetical protein NBCG_00599 [Nocardioidaceae bacterium Broad-1]
MLNIIELEGVAGSVPTGSSPYLPLVIGRVSWIRDRPDIAEWTSSCIDGAWLVTVLDTDGAVWGDFSYVERDTTKCAVGAVVSGADSGPRSSWRVACGPAGEGPESVRAHGPPAVVVPESWRCS